MRIRWKALIARYENDTLFAFHAGDGVRMREVGWQDLLDKLGQYLEA